MIKTKNGKITIKGMPHEVMADATVILVNLMEQMEQQLDICPHALLLELTTKVNDELKGK